MGKRYYCDYCERSFTDEISSRKKHLSSVIHKQARKQHYLRIRDLRELVQDERAKRTCKKFAQGQCPFNENCVNTHYSKEELDDFAQQVEKYEKERFKSTLKLANIEDWLNKRNMKKSGMVLPIEETKSSISEQSSSILPQDLPPSLRLANGYDLRNIELSEWG